MASRYVVGEEGSQRLVDVNSVSDGEKVAESEQELELHKAVFHGDLAGTQAALENGANASIQDRYGICQIWLRSCPRMRIEITTLPYLVTSMLVSKAAEYAGTESI